MVITVLIQVRFASSFVATDGCVNIWSCAFSLLQVSHYGLKKLHLTKPGWLTRHQNFRNVGEGFQRCSALAGLSMIKLGVWAQNWSGNFVKFGLSTLLSFQVSIAGKLDPDLLTFFVEIHCLFLTERCFERLRDWLCARAYYNIWIYIYNLGLNEHDSVFIENCATSLTWTEYERAIKSGILWRSYSSSANSLVIGTQHKVSLKALAWKADFRLKVLLIMISFYCQGIELTTVPRDAWFWDSDLLPSSKVYGNGDCLGS